MNQIAAALEYYWHLRTQDVGAVAASQHTEQRFGVRIPPSEAERVTNECEEIEQEFGTDFCKTVFGSSTGPVYGS